MAETNRPYELLLNSVLKVSSGGKKNAFHFFLGFARLLSVKPETLRVALPEKEDYEALLRLRAYAEQEELDVSVMKTTAARLMTAARPDTIAQKAAEKVKQNDIVPLDALLRQMLSDMPDVKPLFLSTTRQEDVEIYRHKHYPPKPEPLPTDELISRLQELLDHEQGSEREADPPKPTPQPQEDDVEPAAENELPVQAVSRGEKKTGQADGEAAAPEEGMSGFRALTERCSHMYNALREVVIGQDEAVRIFVEGYFQSEISANDEKRKGPRAIFLFAGPPGVGKTFLATEAAGLLELPTRVFNMSEFSDSNASAEELIGHSKSYKEARSGELTGFVRQHPRSVIIFDEIEKCCPSVIHVFLQILDAGVCQDKYLEKDVSFRDTILIFTTNVGKKLYEENRDENLSLLSQKVVLDALQQEKKPNSDAPAFPAAVCSRFATGNVVMFNHLKARYLTQIVQRHFQRQAAEFANRYNCRLEIDENLPYAFLFHMSSNLDARVISSQSRSFIGEKLYEFSRLALGREEVDFEKLQSIHLSLSLPENDTEISSLFTQTQTDTVLLLCGGETAEIFNDHRRFNCVRVDTADELMEKAQTTEFSMILIDPLCGGSTFDDVFSLADSDTEGARAFRRLTAAGSNMPVYLLDVGGRIRGEDRITFCRQGACDVMVYNADNPVEFLDHMDDELDTLYLQGRLEELAGRSRVLNFQEAQYMSDDGTRGEIELYDFRLQTAVDAGSKDLVMTEGERPAERFADVIGAENAKKDLLDLTQFLTNPRKYMLQHTKKPPKGVLLYGPPGTGKTMLAKALAGEAGVSYFATAASDFIQQHVGAGEEHIRRLFATARKYAPSVVFIDEIDAIGKQRNGGVGEHYEKLLNTLLVEMDGFKVDPKRPVIVVAATNFPIDAASANGRAHLDDALVRRFRSHILVDLPNRDERLQYIRLQLAGAKDCAVSEETMGSIADRTTGESLANLENIISKAYQLASEADHPMSDDDLVQALEEYKHGERHSWPQEYYESTARHEAGHAYIAWLGGEKPAFMTIESRGNFGGYMQHDAEENIPTYTRTQLLWKIRCSLAGRASEIVFYGEEKGTNTGVSGDLQNATHYALNMICRYGMSAHGLLLSLDPSAIINTPTGASMLKSAQELLEQEMKETIRLVTEGRDKIDRLAVALLQKNHLQKEEILAVLEN